MAFQFKMFKDVPVPETITVRPKVYEFPFGDVEPAKIGKDGIAHGGGFNIPREFWVTEVGMTDEQIDREKKGSKPSGTRDLRERVKRAFTAWQAKHDKDKKLQLVCVDDRSKDGRYLGMNVWVQPKDLAAQVGKALSERGKALSERAKAALRASSAD